MAATGGRDALELARAIGEPAEADGVIVTVLPYGPLARALLGSV